VTRVEIALELTTVVFCAIVTQMVEDRGQEEVPMATDRPRLGDFSRGARESLIWTLLARQRRWVWTLLALSVLGVVIEFIVADTVVNIIDNSIVKDTEPLGGGVSTLIFLAFFAVIPGFAQLQVASRVGYHVEFELRSFLYHVLHGREPESFETLASGQLVTRAITDLSALRQVASLIPALAVAGVTLVAIALYVFTISPLLALLAFSTLPINILILSRFWNRLRALSWWRFETRAGAASAIDEHVRGIRVVKAFGRVADCEEAVRIRSEQAYARGMGRVRLLALVDLLLRPVPVIVDAILILVGVRYIVGGEVTIGEFTLVLALTRLLTWVARLIDEIAAGWTNADAGGGRLQDILEVEKGADHQLRGAPPASGEGLSLVGVGLATERGSIVEDLDLMVGHGQLAVVNQPSPSGRKALVAILTGDIATSVGRASLDGAVLSDLSATTRLSLLRVLSEEPFIFGRTVRENLDLAATAGAGKLSDAKLWAVLGVAGVSDVIERLPGGLDAVLGDRGLTLSGGERQRVAVARALVEPPRLLVIEDALSAVNPSMEVEILRRLKSFAPRTAVVVITRRPSAIPVADVVVEVPSTHLEVVRGEERTQFDEGSAMNHALAEAVVAEGEPVDRPTVLPPPSGGPEERPSVRSVIAPFRRQIILIAIALMAFTVAFLVPTALTRVVIDAAERRDVGTVDRIAVALVGVAVIVGATSYLLTVYYGKVDEGVLFLLRRRVHARLMRLGIDFYDRELPGAVATRVVRDLDVISGFIDGALFLIAIGAALAVGTMVMLLIWSPLVASVVAGFVVVFAALTALQLRLIHRAYRRQRHAYGETITRLQEDFAGRRLIAAYSARPAMAAAFEQAARELRSADRWATSVSNGYEILARLIGALAAAVLLAVAGQQHLDGEITTGTVIAIIAFLDLALAPVIIFGSVVQLYLAARVSFRKVGELWDAPTGPKPASKPAQPAGRLDSCRVENVSFTYPGTDRAVLRDISFAIEPGRTVAVVGPTGAGKSSIAKLLARLYDVDEGSVALGGLDVRSIDPTTLRRRVGVVPQEPFLFAGTIASNIAFGRPEATSEEIAAAARRVGALGELEALESGLETEVHEDGANIAVPHRQLVALARVALIEPHLMVLDEATSALEPEQEERVMAALRRLSQTTIIIAHRLAVAQLADEVVVIEAGTVVEHGTHAELLVAEGPYSSLWGQSEQVEARQL